MNGRNGKNGKKELFVFMKRVLSITMLVSLIAQAMGPLSYAQANQALPDDSLSEYASDVGSDIVDEVLFQNLSALAGPSCSLYALGQDLVNFFYDGQWSVLDSVLEISVLFRNSSWRELIWAINDQREAYINELTKLKKQQCVLTFARPETNFEQGDAGSQRLLAQMDAIDERVAELEAKVQYFGEQRRNMLFDRPQFIDPELFSGTYKPLPSLDTDKIFYVLLLDSIDVDWEQFLRDSKQFLLSTREDLRVVLESLPDACFAVVNVADELELYFTYVFHLEEGRYVDSEGNSYASFKEFVENNQAAIVDSYTDFCQKDLEKNKMPKAPPTSAELQFKEFQRVLKSLQKTAQARISEVQHQQQVFQKRRVAGEELSEEEQQQFQALKQQRGRYLAMVDYYQLVQSKVGSSASQSLTQLSERLTKLVEAVLGVMRDRNGTASSRLSFSERFQKSKERQLQQICGRIEQMYRQSGRDTGDLPVIGTANGYTYCRAKPECEGVNLSNFFGGSEGRKKLAECSGFLFNEGELGPSQLTQDVIRQVGDDIGYLLEQRSYNDLLKARNLHFESLRNRYGELYKTQGATTVVLENMLTDVSKDLDDVKLPSVFNPQGSDPRTQNSVINKVYRDFWTFLDQQEGSCPAPETPEE